MRQEIIPINLWATAFMMKGAGGVNCYLVNTGTGFILIDAGFPSRRADLVNEMANAGCKPGNLKLIVITHADLDHTGHCAYLRGQFGVKIATHQAETEAVESGNMALNRKNNPGTIPGLILSFISLISRSNRFKPDIYVQDGDDLSGYGFNARVLHLPGHSQGSIGVLTADGDLFCGDLLLNIDRPAA